MQVCELAKEMGVESNEVLTALGLEVQQGAHLKRLSDTQIAAAKTAFVKLNETGKKPIKHPDKVMLWSLVHRHSIATPAGPIVFHDWRLVLRKDNEKDKEKLEAIKTIRVPPPPEMYVVEDKPFDDEGKATDFRKLLTDLIFTGQGNSRDDISRKGMACVMALFWPGETGDLGADRLTPERLIERALRMKSIHPLREITAGG